MAVLSTSAHHAAAQTSGTVTGIGQWTKVGNYGASSTSTSAQGVGALGVQCVTSSGYVYCVGGQNPQGTDTSNVYFAKPTATGSISGWTETTDYGAASGTTGSGGVGIEWPSCVTYGTFIYCVGGALSASPYVTSKSFYASLSSTGVGPWTETTDYGAASGTTGGGGVPSFQLACVEDSGYIYCVGGVGATSKVFYAQLLSSGIGPWQETTDYGAASGTSGTGGVPIGSTACVDDAGYMYCVGGDSTNFKTVSDVFYAPVSSTGVGAWSEATDYGASSGSSGTGGVPIYGTNCVLASGYVICIAGDTTGNAGTAGVYFGKDEDILGWLLGDTFPVDDYWEDCIQIYGWIYCWGADSQDSYAAPIEGIAETTSSSTIATTTTPVTTTTTVVSTTTSTTTIQTTTTTSTTTAKSITSSTPTTSSSSAQSETETTVVPHQSQLGTTLEPQYMYAGGKTADDAFFLSLPKPSGGTITYYSYSGPNCTGTQTALGSPVQVPPSGIPPNSPTATFPVPGSYYFSATYSGDATDSPAMSRCEELIVLPVPTTSTTYTLTFPAINGTGGETVVTITSVTPGTSNDDLALVGVGIVIVIAVAGGYIITRSRGVPKTTEKPPPPPPPPPQNPPPPTTVAPPLVTKGRNPCPPGTEPETRVTDVCEFDYYLEGSATVTMDKVYVAGEEDVEEALKNFEKFHTVTEVATFIQALLTEPVEIASNIIEGSFTGTGAKAATNGIKRLVEQIGEVNKYGYMRVICPQVHFMVQCVVTHECKNGYWVVTEKHLNIQMVPKDLAPMYFPGDGPVLVNSQAEVNTQLGKFHSQCTIKNADANRKLQQCQDSCGKE